MSYLIYYFRTFLLKIKDWLPENVVDWLNGISFIVSIWLFIFPYPFFKELFCILACIPILGIIITIFKENITFDSYINRDPNQDIGEQNSVPGNIVPCAIILALSAYKNFECENYYILIKHVGMVFLFFSAIFILTHIIKKLKLQIVSYFFIAIWILIYSYGITFGINCLFDSSSPQRFRTSILDKYSGGGGDYPDTYHFTIAPWGNHKYTEDISVSRKRYDAYNIDYTIYIDQQKGLFNIPWYHVEDSKALYPIR
ncbi:hypothetical protein [Cytophaga hutchinsonii]|uniref:Uncharacterized protein n=1 Tax=Cytophaga hutchinsonii (strain ATCC 33406 / DSM 1761 / CIP 103989 / NBRC 15051 / NCIMB 9469 / D465) TaxID=269798 RepID=A0A6N4SNB5_CYTH3|nr:hypothetical protein [Cytophaga hutchinsonii]ABG57776.1 hypothetical protein CHU_0487 [Cytophaga hutchinsonii ATCC 33406]SFX05223.1 hypothetical protein SAMN04487930_101327 [Cytophaga hutchinsonii ATCC 33406]